MVVSKPLSSVLIANRGEITVRIARTARSMGIKSIAVFSDADAHALHVQACDEAVAIGGVAPRDSYLRGDRIIDAARRVGAQAIHPGYGFLSENSDFAQACIDAGLVFVGPTPESMRAVGDKIAAKRAALAAGVPVLPGHLERSQSTALLRASAREIGFPLLIKAAAGGGGRGMRRVNDQQSLDEALESAQREAKAAFGDATVFLERYVERPRHIEVQIVADIHGNIIALGERECSIQRRYQKILEESPSPAVDPALRTALEEAAVAIARAVGYTNAGTIEFMLDPEGRFYFLEMNARLQVEHPVTEMITGLDLVRLQFLIASGERLAIERRPPQGHAIEVRIYAEDVQRGFLPSTGCITTFELPQGDGVRNDVAVQAGSDVSAAYDPMLAKLIVHGTDRANSIDLLSAALASYLVGGVATNIGFLRWLVHEPAFRAGDTATDFLDRHFHPDSLRRKPDTTFEAVIAAAALQTLPAELGPNADVWQRLGAWRHFATPRHVQFQFPDTVVDVQHDASASGWRNLEHSILVAPAGDGVFVAHGKQAPSRVAAWRTRSGVAMTIDGAVASFEEIPPPDDAAEHAHRVGDGAEPGIVQAPMSGTIAKVQVKTGEPVAPFQVLLVMEAMKMEHAIAAPYAGTVTTIPVRPGQAVAAGDVLITLQEG